MSGNFCTFSGQVASRATCGIEFTANSGLSPVYTSLVGSSNKEATRMTSPSNKSLNYLLLALLILAVISSSVAMLTGYKILDLPTIFEISSEMATLFSFSAGFSLMFFSIIARKYDDNRLHKFPVHLFGISLLMTTVVLEIYYLSATNIIKTNTDVTRLLLFLMMILTIASLLNIFSHWRSKRQ
jgi:hypothetical protein